MTSTRLLVIGNGDHCDPQKMIDVIKNIHRLQPISEIIHLDEGIVGEIAGRWGVYNNVTVIPCYPNWDEDQVWNAAQRRDDLIFGVHAPNLVIAFPGGKFTRKLIEGARERCIRVVDLEDNISDLQEDEE